MLQTLHKNCRVTRMLVSYDAIFPCLFIYRNCRGTRMLVSYDLKACKVSLSSKNCRVTRMLVSYDLTVSSLPSTCSNCRVTRMLVSYDASAYWHVQIMTLQGHQNVGELRLQLGTRQDCTEHCRVTRMLVSYVNKIGRAHV